MTLPGACRPGRRAARTQARAAIAALAALAAGCEAPDPRAAPHEPVVADDPLSPAANPYDRARPLQQIAGTPLDVARPPPGVSARDHGARLLAEGRPELAEKAFRLSLMEEGAKPSTLFGLGVALHAQGRLARARDALEQSLAIDPDNAAAQNNLGVVLYELGAYDEAETRFGTAAALKERQGLPPDPDVALNLGLARDARARTAAIPGEAPQPTHDLEPTGDERYLLIKAEEGVE